MPRQQVRSMSPSLGPESLPPGYTSSPSLMSPFPLYPQQQWQVPLLTTPRSSWPASNMDMNEMQNHIAQLQDQLVVERRHRDAAAARTPDTMNNSLPTPQDFGKGSS